MVAAADAVAFLPAFGDGASRGSSGRAGRRSRRRRCEEQDRFVQDGAGEERRRREPRGPRRSRTSSCGRTWRGPPPEFDAMREDRRGRNRSPPGHSRRQRRVDASTMRRSPPQVPAMNHSSSRPNRPSRGLARFAILAALVAAAPLGARRHPHRRDSLDDRPGGVARHPRRAGDQALAGRDRGREGPLHDPQRRQRHDDGDQERAAPHQRGQGRPHHRLVGDADLARRRRDRGQARRCR